VGRPGEFFATQVAGPVGADFHIVLPISEFDRVANLVAWPPQPYHPADLDPNGPVFKTFNGPVMDQNIERSRTERWRRADIGAANGHGNARSVARLQSAVACGGEVDGVQLLSPKTIDRIFEVQSDGIDVVLGSRLKIGVGYGLPWPEALPFVPEGRVCFGTGAGGSMVIADADRHLTVAYVMNKMAIPGPNGIVSPIAAALVEQACDILNRSFLVCIRPDEGARSGHSPYRLEPTRRVRSLDGRTDDSSESDEVAAGLGSASS
jgi:CubicO group peptidase (beta-lactamase class C family)